MNENEFNISKYMNINNKIISIDCVDELIFQKCWL